MKTTTEEIGKYSRLGFKYSRLKSIKDALEFYGMMDSKAGIPALASPAMIAISLVEELMVAENKELQSTDA